MKTETIVMCVVALILGMLLANMLKSVCGCESVVEGQGCDTYTTNTIDSTQCSGPTAIDCRVHGFEYCGYPWIPDPNTPRVQTDPGHMDNFKHALRLLASNGANHLDLLYIDNVRKESDINNQEKWNVQNNRIGQVTIKIDNMNEAANRARTSGVSEEDVTAILVSTDSTLEDRTNELNSVVVIADNVADSTAVANRLVATSVTSRINGKENGGMDLNDLSTMNAIDSNVCNVFNPETITCSDDDVPECGKGILYNTWDMPTWWDNDTMECVTGCTNFPRYGCGPHIS